MSTEYTEAQMRLIDEHRDINTDYEWWNPEYDEFITTCKAFGLTISTRQESYYSNRQKKNISYSRPEIYFSLYQQGAGAYFGAEKFTIVELIEAGRAVMALPDDHDNAWMKTAEEGVAKQLRDNFERLEREFGVRMLSAHMYDIIANTVYGVSTNHETVTVDLDDYYTRPDSLIDPEDEALAESLENDWPEALTDMLRDVASALHGTLEAQYEHLQEDDVVWETLEANGLADEIEEDEDEEEHA